VSKRHGARSCSTEAKTELEILPVLTNVPDKRVIYSYYKKPSPNASIRRGGFISSSWGRDIGRFALLILGCRKTVLIRFESLAAERLVSLLLMRPSEG
jgi:hypothetical protein